MICHIKYLTATKRLNVMAKTTKLQLTQVVIVGKKLKLLLQEVPFLSNLFKKNNGLINK